MDRDDRMFFAGLANLTRPLKSATRAIDAVEMPLSERRGAHPGIGLPIGATARAGTPESRFARGLIACRRRREAVLGEHLFGEPCWDMLLDLFAAHDEAVNVSESSLCIAATVPSTTVLRWVRAMVEEGTFVERRDPNDGRRVWIALAPEMADRMRMLLKSWMMLEAG